jgi:serine O-acetyltransferase
MSLLQDPACTSHTMALLYYKGYHSLQTHRIAHALWSGGKQLLAHALQSRLSEVSWEHAQRVAHRFDRH